MLYMSAAREDGRRKPAGVFYFHIQEPRAKMDKASGRVPLPEEPADPVPADPFLAEVEKEIRKQFRLKGRMVDDPETVEEIAGEFQKTSDVVNLTRSRDGGLRGDVMTEAEFEELEQAAAEKVVSLCADLAGGRIDIRPMKEGDWTACQYCDYQSVCRFDRSFRGCRYEEIDE
ncbi:PD-(D/E)XK nuclease family protein [Eubacterium pyruvativorans]|uniref:PD-(D/E)XK nuclease family protein n=1 Tax=Eubacterium pyruvativorans TaxID=155865 RepID=UPI001567E00E|nr:PD-(D/E)XK nuclease family protein [Eubacterium pyruvativorans]